MQLINHLRKSIHTGAATLVMALVLVMIGTLLVLLAGNIGILRSKSIANINRDSQSFNAAQAGLEFGINYLNTNNTTIIGTPVGGYIPAYSDSNTTNVTLENNSRYTVTNSNPIANNYELIRITSVGTSDDGSSTHTITQLVQFGSTLLNVPSSPLTSLGNVNLSGNSEIINTHSGTTVSTGGNVTLTGSASTILNSGVSSTAGNIQSDIQSSVGSLASMTDGDFFSAFFGLSQSSVKSTVTNYYSNNTNTNYSATLSGMTGRSIWIDQTGGTAVFNGNVTIGSTTDPVILVINGPVNFAGNLTVYGYVFVPGTSTTNLLGNVTVVGGMATTDNVNAMGSIQVSYSPSVLNNLQNMSSMRYYAKVPGSWKDF